MQTCETVFFLYSEEFARGRDFVEKRYSWAVLSVF